MTNLNMNTEGSEVTLSEDYVQECFHSYLRSSLAQAKLEGLLDTDLLSSAESDLMITGPALCLYFAALRSVTDPPSVPLPRRAKGSGPPTDLSFANCPPSFRPFLIVWSNNVVPIQALPPEQQHDLARIICNLEPISHPLNRRLNGIAADLRAVAIEISMRRTFQDKYADDLQAAIDAGTRDDSGRVRASFVPPPAYTSTRRPPHTHSHTHSRTPSLTAPTASASPSPPSPTHSILGPDTPAIDFVRETLYATLGEVLERMPSLRRLLRSDPPRAYFASVAFAILDVATSSATRPELKPEFDTPAIRGVLGQTLALADCPPELRPFMLELCAIGKAAHVIEEEDSAASVAALQRGKEPPVPRLERVRRILEGGVGHAYDDAQVAHSEGAARPTDPRRRTTSTENRAVAFANRINALALSMTKLRAFRERQEMVFKVLAGVGQ